MPQSLPGSPIRNNLYDQAHSHQS